MSKLYAAAAALMLVVLVGLLISLGLAVSRGNKQALQTGQALCASASASAAAAATASAAASTASQAQADIARGNQAATDNARAQTRIVTIYRNLESEARHVSPDPVDACVLPAGRLRIWLAANAGPGTVDPADQSATPGQSHAAASAAAATDIGLDARSGAEPPSGGASVPPTGGAAVRAAAAHGDRAP